MKKVFFYSLLSMALLSSCDNKFDGLDRFNVPPVLVAFNQTTATSNPNLTVTDSVKTSLKHGKGQYNFILQFSDVNSNIVGVNASIVGDNTGSSGVVKLQANNKPLTGNIDVGASGGSIEFEVMNLTGLSGTIAVRVNVVDAFGATTSLNLSLIAFSNLPPVAAFTVSPNNINGDKFQYIFDGSASADKDARFEIGTGGIQSWNWTISGVALPPQSHATLNYVFPGIGGYQISLTVTDSDGVKSSAVQHTVTVN